MPLTDHDPPLTVVVAVVVVWLKWSVITTEIESPLSPVPLTVTLLTFVPLMYGALDTDKDGATVIFVSVWVIVVLLPTASVSVAE